VGEPRISEGETPAEPMRPRAELVIERFWRPLADPRLRHAERLSSE
jgi:hypothetical protein